MPAPGVTEGMLAALSAVSTLSDRTLAKHRAPDGAVPAEPMATTPAEWSRDLVNGSIAASLRGHLVRDPADVLAQRDAERAEIRRLGLDSYAIPGEPVARIDLSGYRAGDVLRVLNAHPGTVTIEGTGTEADGRYALEQFVEGGPGFGTARLRRIGA